MRSPSRTRLIPTLLALLLLAGVGAWALTPPPEHGPILAKHYVPKADQWSTLAASGPVESRAPEMPATRWIEVQRGDRIQPYTNVRTGKKGRATLSRNGDLLLVDPNSELELPGDRLPGTTVNQTRGSVVYEVDGARSREFKVVTPYLVAGVKGTVFRVTVTERYASVTVEEGTVEVASRRDDELFEIRAGETVLMDVEEGSSMELVSPERRLEQQPSREARRVARTETARLDRSMERFERELGPGNDYTNDAELATRLDDENDLEPDAGKEDDGLSEDLLDEDLRSGDTGALDSNDPDPGLDPDPDPFIDPFEDPIDPDDVDPGSGNPGSSGGKNDLQRIDPDESTSN